MCSGLVVLMYWTWGQRLLLLIARFVAKTLIVCSGLVVLMYWTWGQRLLLLPLERRALIIEINAELRRKNAYFCSLELQVVSGSVR